MMRPNLIVVLLLGSACGTSGAGSASAGETSSSAGETSSSPGETTAGSSSTTGGPVDGPWARAFPIIVDQVAAGDDDTLALIGVCYDLAIDGSQLAPPGSYGICLAKLGPGGAIQWSLGFGGSSSAYSVGHAIAIGPTGDIFAAGTFDGTIDLGGGALTASSGVGNVYVASFDAGGAHRWSKRFGGACSPDTVCAWSGALTTDPAGNLTIYGMLGAPVDFGGGPLDGDLFLASFDANGAHRWSKAFVGGAHDQEEGGTSIAADAAGNIYIGGIIADSAPALDLGGGPLPAAIGGAPTPIFVASFDGAGGHRWSRRFVPAGEPLEGGWDVDGELGEAVSIRAIAVDPGGDVYFTGALRGTVDFGGGPLASVGGMPAGSSVFLYSDTYVVALDGVGGHRWSRRFGDDVVDEGRALTLDAAGNVVLASHMESGAGSVDFGGGPLTGQGAFLASFSPSGAHRWSVAHGEGVDTSTHALATGAGEAVFLSGWTMGPLHLGELVVPGNTPFVAHIFPGAP